MAHSRSFGRPAFEHAGCGFDVSAAVERGALDPYAMLGFPRGESSRPAAATAERRYRESRRTDPLKLGLDVVHAKANVVQTFAVRLQPFGERVAGIERLNELEPRVAQIEVGQAHRNLGRLIDGYDFKPQAVTEVDQRCFGVGNQHGDVVEASDHFVARLSNASRSAKGVKSRTGSARR